MLFRSRKALHLRKELEGMISDPYHELALIASTMGNQEFKININYLQEFSSIELRERKLLNIYVPKFELVFAEYSNKDISVNFPENIRLIRQDSVKILNTLINMAEYEESIRRLIDEVRNTKIKVNALEKRVIPEIEKELISLKKFLKEKDREERIRLKNVKEMVKAVS